ncbi:unnamed protein product (macronuclear) [Paramecium tetraurelia]|uniref:Uncharacterized protein n=1 Tax=Paramecium tetraurelia TaxID=5888 RepID=A0DS87_PARTE|nr:uncharacterized protein GSPATT00019608001 [Paramecium tetraurelia]CAK85904.1 unnamed protein product [Paramecium tetraurelia]|eukprot:XP_001453301.1 hypothetical protein (macronuclear) [Paramecium tetraurelia strain d4-2]
MIEKQKFAALAQLLKRMFRQDLQSPILDIDQLIQEVSKIKQLLGNQPPMQIHDKPFKQTQFQVDLGKNFRCQDYGLQVISQLKKLLQDAAVEYKVSLVSDHLFFLIYLGKFEEAFETMLEFQELLGQCSEPEIPNIKEIIIDTNVLFLRLFQEV